MRLKRWIKTVPTLVIIGSVLFLVLSVGSGLLLWGSNFSHNMVHNQLVEQKIQFPPKGSTALDPKEFPGLQRYAGQTVDNGAKAKAYADQFIAVHLNGIGKGQTYSQVSAVSLADPKNTALAGEVQTLFRGETLRGLLLYAWGWSVVGEIALWVAIAAMAGAAAVLLALDRGLPRTRAPDQAHRGAGPDLAHGRPGTDHRRLSQRSLCPNRSHYEGPEHHELAHTLTTVRSSEPPGAAGLPAVGVGGAGAVQVSLSEFASRRPT